MEGEKQMKSNKITFVAGEDIKRGQLLEVDPETGTLKKARGSHFATHARGEWKVGVPVVREVPKWMGPSEHNIDVILPDPFTQEAYEKIKAKLERLANEWMRSSGGLYSSVYTSSLQRTLAELRTRIVSDKRKWTDAEIQVALSWFEDEKPDDYEFVRRIKKHPGYMATLPDKVVQIIIQALQQMKGERNED